MVEQGDNPRINLIPQPRSVRIWDGNIRVGQILVGDLPRRLSKYHDVIQVAIGKVGRCDEWHRLSVEFVVATMPEENYELSISEKGVKIRSGDSLGALHAIRTIVDLWDAGDGRTLPCVDISDGPSFPTRGIFAESFFGTDLMSLEDWQQLLDRVGQLKLNTLGISIYGCWDIHHAERNEFLFVPLREFPELETPQRMVTWDSATKREVEERYLPKMFEDDYFGDLVRYAAERGVEVVPHLGGPGHSTLIPRMTPEVSALDERGEPTGYGYCVSSQRSRATLERLIRCLVEQHLLPNGIRRLHVAGDEYYPIRNVDPRDPRRVVSPYCECRGCRQLKPGRMLIEYLLLVGRVLADYGVTMVHWHDTLVREEVLDEYLDRVKDVGLPKPAIAWWKYNDPVPTPDASRVETWSSPTVGLSSFLFPQDWTPNIEATLRRGHQAGAAGVFAYALPDPADYINYAYLAGMAWNLEGTGGAREFSRRWAESVCPGNVEPARHALSLWSGIAGCYPLMMYVVQQLLPFFAIGAEGSAGYSDDLLRVFASVRPPLADVLRQTADTLREAVVLMPETRDVRYWPNPGVTWRRETRRLIESITLFLDVLDAARQVEDVSDDRLAVLSRKSTDLLQLTAETKSAYLVPATLREHWSFVREIGPTLRRIRNGAGLPEPESWYVWML